MPAAALHPNGPGPTPRQSGYTMRKKDSAKTSTKFETRLGTLQPIPPNRRRRLLEAACAYTLIYGPLGVAPQ